MMVETVSAKQGSSFSDRFEQLLDRYRKPDGSKWTGAEIARETRGTVTASYITSLRKGRIRKPGLDKLRAIARVMGFSWHEWLEESDETQSLLPSEERGSTNFSDLLNRVFAEMPNYRTGKPFTQAEVANLSGGELSGQAIKAMREGKLKNPTMAQLQALSDVFGISPAYWFSPQQTLPRLSKDTLKALSDQNAQLILKKASVYPIEIETC